MVGDTSMGTDDVVLAWQRGDRPASVEFVVTSSYAGEFLALLAERDVAATQDARQVRGVGADVLTTVVAVVENPAAWAAFGLAVKTFLDRHKGKRIRVDERGHLDVTNYSARDLERIIRAMSEEEPDNGDE